EQSGGDGGTLSVGQSVNLGNVWVKSRIEDVTVDLQLVGGGSATAAVAHSGGPGGGGFARSDLNADGVVHAADRPLFRHNALADLSSMTMVQQALAGDLDGDGDNDVNDFAIFKADFDSANGAGAFQAMISAVPEPGSLAMLLLGGTGALVVRGRRSRTLLA